MIANGTKEHLPSLLERRHGPRKPKLAQGLAKIPYYTVTANGTKEHLPSLLERWHGPKKSQEKAETCARAS